MCVNPDKEKKLDPCTKNLAETLHKICDGKFNGPDDFKYKSIYKAIRMKLLHKQIADDCCHGGGCTVEEFCAYCKK